MPRTKKTTVSLFDERKLEEIIDIECLEETKAKRTTSRKTSEPKSIVEGMDKVLSALHKSELDAASMRKARPSLNYLKSRLNLTDMQIIFLSMLCDAGRPLDYSQFSNFISCHRIRLICFDSELQELVHKGILNRIPCDHGEDDYVVRDDAMKAYQKNEAYERPNIQNLNFDDFLYHFRYIMNKKDHGNMTTDDFMDSIHELFDANKDLRFVREINGYKLNNNDFIVLLVCVFGFIDCNESVEDRYIANFLRPGLMTRGVLSKLRHCSGTLFENKLITQSCEEGFMSTKKYELTDSAKENLLQGYELEASNLIDPRKGLLHYEDIKEKTLFYNDDEKKKVERLADLLKEENLKGIQERLEQKGYRKGFATLFYGAPGVGKTETVLQLARQTGRDIFQVNIAGLRDKYVGESEKNIKAIFTRYRSCCKHCERMPILLFNEADAIISKRTENIEHSVDQMNNAIQNIILQEMENLEGILIATTNLTTNLDDAFDRRFLYSIEFKKPSIKVKASIWQSMINDISEKDALTLSEEYDFSGGEIENISRKLTVDSILYGCETSIKLLREYCDSEAISKKQKNQRSKISGFGHCG